MEGENRGVRRLVIRVIVVVAAFRVARLHRRTSLDRMVERLRDVRTLPGFLRRPEAFRDEVNRWYRWLPPRGVRSCLKRSLLLLDLWSRCGLEPQFHLGLRKVDGRPDGHAWVTAGDLDSGVEPGDGYEEAFTG